MPFIPRKPVYLPHQHIDLPNGQVDQVDLRAFEKSHAHGSVTSLQYTATKTRIYFSDERDPVLFKLFYDVDR